MSYDGIFEAVYNKQGILLTEYNDPQNMGTYNYGNPDNWLAHGIYDVAPYLRYGNTIGDIYESGSEQKNRDKVTGNAEVLAYRAEIYNKMYK